MTPASVCRHSPLLPQRVCLITLDTLGPTQTHKDENLLNSQMLMCLFSKGVVGGAIKGLNKLLFFFLKSSSDSPSSPKKLVSSSRLLLVWRRTFKLEKKKNTK